MIDIAQLKQNVSWLNKAVSGMFLAGLGAIIASFLLLSDRIDDRFDKLGDKIDRLSDQVGQFRVDLTEVKQDVERTDKPKP